MIKLLANKRGLGLVELMIVMIVLSIGIIPIALVQTRSNTDVFNSGQRTEALNIGQMQMERTKAMGFNNAVSDSGTVDQYDWRTVVQPAGFGLREITVTVQWKEQGAARSIQLNNVLSTR